MVEQEHAVYCRSHFADSLIHFRGLAHTSGGLFYNRTALPIDILLSPIAGRVVAALCWRGNILDT